jgi:hypothetical protein
MAAVAATPKGRLLGLYARSAPGVSGFAGRAAPSVGSLTGLAPVFPVVGPGFARSASGDPLIENACRWLEPP